MARAEGLRWECREPRVQKAEVQGQKAGGGSAESLEHRDIGVQRAQSAERLKCKKA